MFRPQMQSMAGHSNLDDPDYAAFAWGRFRRIMRWMTLVSALTAIIALALLWWSLGEMYLHMAIATLLGVFFTMLLGTVLMSLVFLSAGTGHDGAIEDPTADEAGPDRLDAR